MYLDSSYFTGELSLPILSAKRTSVNDPTGIADKINQVSGEYSLEWYIERYEEEFLRKLLGDRLFEAFKEGISATSPLQIWIDLRDRIYRKSGGYSFSPAANYVYFHVTTAAASKTAMTGEVKSTNDRAVNVSPDAKMVKAWNDMCDNVHHIREWIFIHRKEIFDAVPEWSDYWQPWYASREFIPINRLGV